MNLTMRPAGFSDFAQVFSLMEKAFPPAERREEEKQRLLLENPAYSCRILERENGIFLGFLAAWRFEGFRFVEHFAVNEAARGHGVGTHALQMWMDEELLPVILEVELPETEAARRRIGFYRRLGFVLNDFSYTQPPMQQGRQAIPLKIMSWPSALSPELFSRWRGQLYHTVYGRDSLSF